VEPAAASEHLVSIRRGAEIVHDFIELYRITEEPSLCYALSVMEGQYQEGMKEGMEKGKVDIAKKMKQDGIPAETIAKYTSLSAEEIDGL